MCGSGVGGDDESVGVGRRRVGVEGEERVDAVGDRGDAISFKEQLIHDCINRELLAS